jgi:hypothetical protein
LGDPTGRRFLVAGASKPTYVDGALGGVTPPENANYLLAPGSDQHI